ncbi:hypothetical protein Sru01_65920 [Sphaerisporangium rufum]|uniref:DAGKc domain-containing protein n=1 Tax=Sphaerisporangium rufum TaxID=1381558 RepID=A0A919RBC7_9ACTN|nr:diacylglycerol kinase family protein [Sphaerisporangium rufum]GII81610.1 hypothetical protein Sru01_65920 [Sphaerisporangium rufum]
MRALLLVNPKATTTNRRTREVLIRALGAAVELSVEETGYRGHAAELAGAARVNGFDVVAVLGGDGTVNEAVNGLAGAPPGPGGRHPAGDGKAAPRTGGQGTAAVSTDGGGANGDGANRDGTGGDGTGGDGTGGSGGDGDRRPALIVIPGGSANVFARSLGLPNDPVEATGVVLEALREGRRRTIGLGVASWSDGGAGEAGGERYFTFCAGLGYDAEVVRAVEGLRAAGYRASPARYVGTAVRHFFITDRRHPALRLERPHHPPVDGIFLAIVCNTAPWTYVGNRPVHPTPRAGFDTRLDLLGLRRMGLPWVLDLVRQMMAAREGPPRGRHLLHTHDEAEFTLAAGRPVAFQLDGDYLGERERVTFRSVPSALQVLL